MELTVWDTNMAAVTSDETIYKNLLKIRHKHQTSGFSYHANASVMLKKSHSVLWGNSGVL